MSTHAYCPSLQLLTAITLAPEPEAHATQSNIPRRLTFLMELYVRGKHD
jgi:hypothetical protein